MSIEIMQVVAGFTAGVQRMIMRGFSVAVIRVEREGPSMQRVNLIAVPATVQAAGRAAAGWEALFGDCTMSLACKLIDGQQPGARERLRNIDVSKRHLIEMNALLSWVPKRLSQNVFHRIVVWA